MAEWQRLAATSPSLSARNHLRHLIGESDCERIIYVQHIEMCGCVLYRAICKKDLEGIICQRKDEMYSVSGQWLKVLNPNYTQHEDRHEIFTAVQSRAGRVST